jgi:hypothetical protein
VTSAPSSSTCFTTTTAVSPSASVAYSLSPMSSPSPSPLPASHRSLSHAAEDKTQLWTSLMVSVDRKPRSRAHKECAHCGTAESSQWRRGPFDKAMYVHHRLTCVSEAASLRATSHHPGYVNVLQAVQRVRSQVQPQLRQEEAAKERQALAGAGGATLFVTSHSYHHPRYDRRVLLFRRHLSLGHLRPAQLRRQTLHHTHAINSRRGVSSQQSYRLLVPL